jgi:hypothetical protein
VSQTFDRCRATCQLLRHFDNSGSPLKHSAPIFSQLRRCRSEWGFGSDSAPSIRAEGNRMLAEDRVRVRRGHIHHDSATGEIIRHAPGVSVPAGWTSLQSLRHLLNLPDRRGWGMTPHALLALPSPASPLDSHVLRKSTCRPESILQERIVGRRKP